MGTGKAKDRPRGQIAERKRLRAAYVEEIRRWLERQGRLVPPLEAFARVKRNGAFSIWSAKVWTAARGEAEVCPEWCDEVYGYENFARDVGQRPGPSYGIYRIDTKLAWQPGNTEWRYRRRRYKGLVSPSELKDPRREWREILAAKHGLDPDQLDRNKSELRHRWHNMCDRCNNAEDPDHRFYGARGIRVCREWDDDRTPFGFENYAAYILSELGPPPSPKHSLDRIDVYQDYEEGNLRWATPEEQRANQGRVIGPPPPGWRGGRRFTEEAAESEALILRLQNEHDAEKQAAE